MTDRKRRSARSGRPRLLSPGRLPVAGRDERRRFWAGIASGMASEDAAVAAGVPQAIGTRWFRKAGGMPPAIFGRSAKPLSGRYLSLAEREELAILHAQGAGVREIARQMGRSASTISRELRRNAATRSGGLDYRATTAQWHADRAARRPKPVKLAVNVALRAYVQDRLAGVIVTHGIRMGALSNRNGRPTPLNRPSTWNLLLAFIRWRTSSVGKSSTRMTRSSHSALNFCGNCPSAFAAIASNSSSDGSVAKCRPGGEENGLAAMVLSLMDNPGIHRRTAVWRQAYRAVGLLRKPGRLRRFVWQRSAVPRADAPRCFNFDLDTDTSLIQRQKPFHKAHASVSSNTRSARAITLAGSSS